MRILTVPEETAVLRTKSSPIEKIDAEVAAFLKELGETLKGQKDPAGVGLSAIQVGRQIRAFAMLLPEQRTKAEGRRTKVKQFIFIHLVGIILILTTNNPVRNFLFRVIPRDAPNNASRGNLVTQIATVASLPHNDERIAALEGGITLTKSEHGGTESGDIRRLVWNGAVQLVKQRPVLGFGPETFGLTYWQVRLKEHNLTSEWNFLYNKAHNEWLNLAANTGLFGLGTHLFLIIWFTVWYLRRFFNHSGHFNHSTFFLAAILAALLGIEVVNFFGFSTVTVGTYQYLFMAVAVAVEKDEGRRTKDEGNTGRILKGVSLKTAYCLLFTILLGTFYLLFQISRLLRLLFKGVVFFRECVSQ